MDRAAGVGVYRRVRDPASDVQSALSLAGNRGVVDIDFGMRRRVEYQVAQSARRRLRARLPDRAAVRPLQAAAMARAARGSIRARPLGSGFLWIGIRIEWQHGGRSEG